MLCYQNLVHFLDQIVDVLLSVAKVTALDEVVGDFPPAASWAGKLDWVQVVVGGLEVIADGVDLVHQVLDAVDAQVAHGLLDNIVVADLDSLTVNLDGASLVDHVLDGLLSWVAPSDEWIAAERRRFQKNCINAAHTCLLTSYCMGRFKLAHQTPRKDSENGGT